MATNKLIPSYKLVANNTPTAAKAPYYGMVIPVGSIAYGDILDTMVANGTFMTEATAEYLLTAFYEYCSDAIAENVVRVSTGTVSVYPMIGGSFDSEDAAFDPTRNTLYVGASFSQDVRNAVAGVTPTYSGEETASGVHLDSEMDIASQRFKVIDGKGNFRLAGRNLAVPDGADESIGLYTKDGLVKVSDVIVSENDGGQRLTCHLKGDESVPVGQYKLIVKTHGLDPTAPLATLSLTVTNVTAIKPIAESSDGVVKVKTCTPASVSTGGTLTLTGTGLAKHDDSWGIMMVTSTMIDTGETVIATEIQSQSDTEIVLKMTYTGEKPAGSHPSRLWVAYLPEAGGAAETLEVPYTFVIA